MQYQSKLGTRQSFKTDILSFPPQSGSNPPLLHATLVDPRVRSTRLEACAPYPEPLTQPRVSRHSSGIGNAALIAREGGHSTEFRTMVEHTGADGKCAKIVSAAAISPQPASRLHRDPFLRTIRLKVGAHGCEKPQRAWRRPPDRSIRRGRGVSSQTFEDPQALQSQWGKSRGPIRRRISHPVPSAPNRRYEWEQPYGPGSPSRSCPAELGSE